MAYSVPTPPRPVPGTWQQTPAAKQLPPPPSFQSSTSGQNRLSYALGPSTSASLTSNRPSQPPVQSQHPNISLGGGSEALKPAERAARTINETLASETKFPELDSYLSQGFSSDYEIQGMALWAPFQKVRMYNIPDQIFEQYNRAQVSTSMGLFAELHYAWVAIDNALYMWDYTLANAELFGFEEQPNSITAVKLAVPRMGVFSPSVKHILVIATTAEVLLLGVGSEPSPGGSRTLTLFETKMTVPVKGLDISVISYSAKSGRIFFGGKTENEVYEFTYQQEESWFRGKAGKTCHTSSSLAAIGTPFSFVAKRLEYVEYMVIDDTRDLLYTLSSDSAVRVFHMKPDGGLTLAITKLAADIYSNVGHIIAANESLNSKTKIVSISPIPAQEASRYHLVATTFTGYRIYLSATSSNSWSSSRTSTPMNMQAQHVKTPPLVAGGASTQNSSSSGQQAFEHGQSVHHPIQSLKGSRTAVRYPPGSFFCFTSTEANPALDTLFISSPDPARLARPPEAGQPSRAAESAMWLSLGSRAEDIGLCSSYHPPTSSPAGFGNELAVQFDKPVPEIAILTNTGIHIIRRRRLVDIFAALIQHGGGVDGIEGEIKSFIRTYGRTETLATALAVACGQGMELSSDSRVTRINDPEILEVARRTFIEYGGKPTINQNSIADQAVAAIETVRPSPRHGGIALYLSRLLRSTWKALVAREFRTTDGGYTILPAVPVAKLKNVQEDLSTLQRFFQTNKSFIQGLSGPDTRSASKQDEVALQGEHRALHSLVKFISDTIEGISFVMVLFDERVEEILPLLGEQSRPRFLQLTFEDLFSTKKGSDLAKELVKAIVNRNIAKGSNVEMVAEALRRRCGSFCSAEDVVIFKAQELLKRASEAGVNAEVARNLLNESLTLFQKVAASLPTDYLRSAVKQFTDLQFFAGAIQLVLKVAHETDKGKEALLWMNDGHLESDHRKVKFDYRSQCYDLVHDVINAVDQSMTEGPAFIDGRPTLTARRRNEAYDIISQSDDELFLFNLYDWYLFQGWNDRLLATESPFIVKYLQRKSTDDIAHADLLWRYYGQTNRFYDAACVQLQLARSSFDLPLDRRIEYLSQARANASTYTQGSNRKSKQKLLQDISELLDVASLQDEILQRLKEDSRLPRERRSEVLSRVNGLILTINELFNDFADNAGYYDLCLLIYQVADHRDASQIKATWQQLLQSVHDQTLERGETEPYEAIAEKVRSLGSRLRLSECIFPVPILLPMLEKYAFEHQRNIGPPTWVLDTFLELEVPQERLLEILEVMFYANEAPFLGVNRKVIANDILSIIGHWLHDTMRGVGIIFDSETGATRVDNILQVLLQAGPQAGIDEEGMRMCRLLRERVAQLLH